LHAADRDFGVLLIVHAELIARFEPRHHFLDAVDVHQVGAVGRARKARGPGWPAVFDGAVVRLALEEKW